MSDVQSAQSLVSDQRATLLSKQGLVIIELARALLATVPGERIARVQEYAQRFQASVGTVQAALDHLQACGAARLDARGRLGTYADELNYPLLWALALNRPVTGAMPLPYSRRFAGLATGIRAQFAGQPANLDLRFSRGATRRMQALSASSSDWALVSRFAAETADAHGFAVDTVLLLGPETYMAQHVLLLRDLEATGLHNGMRIGVDYESIDHVFTTRALSRGKQVELVEIDYSEGLRLLGAGVIDATVWSREDLPVDLDTLATIPLEQLDEPEIARLSEGAIIVNRADRSTAHVLQAILDRDELLRVQQEVVQLARLPAY